MVNSGLPIGGTCVNVGCMPSKNLLTVGDELYSREHPRFKALQNGHRPAFDFSTAIAEKDEIVASARQSNYINVVDSFESVTFTEARARFVSPQEVEVNGEVVAGKRFVVAVGSSTKPIPVDGMDRVRWHTNRTIMDLKETPDSLVVIGAGPEGLEFAQMFAHFGSKVSVLIARGHRVLRQEEQEVVDELLRSLDEEGIQFLMDMDLDKVQERSGKKVVTVHGVDGPEELVADELLLATGIQANTSELGLDRARIDVDERGFIQANDHYQTTNSNVFAAGDCIGKKPLETVAAKEGSLAAENALTESQKSINYDHVPHAVFYQPPTGQRRAHRGRGDAEVQRVRVPHDLYGCRAQGRCRQGSPGCFQDGDPPGKLQKSWGAHRITLRRGSDS